MELTQEQIKNGWRVVRLGEALEPVKTTVKKGIEYDSVPMEVISPGKKLPERFERKIFNGSGTRFKNGDTLFARITPCLQNRKIVQVRGLKGGVGFGSTEYFVFRAKESISNKDFIYYLATDDSIVEPAINSMVGASGRQRANESVVKNLEIALPPLPTQTRIAEVLSAYDDLIEDNNKRIKVLEQMAQKLYTEWFVKFKFPGHEKVKMVDSGNPDFGMVPDGWGVEKVGDLMEVIGGGTPSRSQESYFQDGTINWYTPTDLTKSNSTFSTSSSEKITEEALKKSSAKLFPEFSVMMTSRATIGAISINTTPSTTNQGFIVCIPSGKLSLYFLLNWMQSKVDYFISLATGSTFKELGRNKFRELKILVPSSTFLNQFESNVSDIYKDVLNLQKQNQNLKKSRDLLIPQLVGGKLALK